MYIPCLSSITSQNIPDMLIVFWLITDRANTEYVLMHLIPYYEQHYNNSIASTVYLSICKWNATVSCINGKTFQNVNANKMEYQNYYIFDVKVKTYE